MCATPPTVVCRSFWNFTLCFCHGLKMHMWFGYNPQIIFFTVSTFWTFSAARILPNCIDSGHLVCATPPSVLCRSFWNFTDIFVMVWICACGLHIILRLIFCHLLHNLNSVIFQAQIYWKPKETPTTLDLIFVALLLCRWNLFILENKPDIHTQTHGIACEFKSHLKSNLNLPKNNENCCKIYLFCQSIPGCFLNEILMCQHSKSV